MSEACSGEKAISWLDPIYDGFVRLFRVTIAHRLGKPVEVRKLEARECNFEDFVMGLSAPSCMSAYRVEPLDDAAVFVMDSALVYMIVDSVLGGGGGIDDIDKARMFSSIELRVAQTIARDVLGDMERAWSLVVPAKLSLVRTGVDPRLIDIVSPERQVVVMTMQVATDAASGTMAFVVPLVGIEPFLCGVEGGRRFDMSAIDPRLVERLAAGITDSSAELTAGVELARLPVCPVPERCPGGDEGIIDLLADMDPEFVANRLSLEHPQTVAIVLARLRPRQAGEIVSFLPPVMRAQVVLRIADIGLVSPDILDDVDEALRKEFAALGGMQRLKVGGIEKAVELFGHLDRRRESQILDRLDIIRPPLAEVIRKHLFTFEDVFALDPRSIQLIVRETSNDVLTLAMKTASDDIKEKIFANISQRAADMIREDLEHMGPVRLADVDRAQVEIVKIARRLEEEGRVVIGRGGEDVLV